MLYLSIMAVGGLVAFFFYHRITVNRFEISLLNLESELDYLSDKLQINSQRLTIIENPKIKSKTSTRKVGRPRNPNSTRQKKLNITK